MIDEKVNAVSDCSRFCYRCNRLSQTKNNTESRPGGYSRNCDHRGTGFPNHCGTGHTHNTGKVRKNHFKKRGRVPPLLSGFVTIILFPSVSCVILFPIYTNHLLNHLLFFIKYLPVSIMYPRKFVALTCFKLL